MSEITPKELHKRLQETNPPILIDIREPFEREISSIGGVHIPLGEVESRLSEIPKDTEVIVYCRSGARSRRLCNELATQHGYKNLINLTGGILRWSDEVDATVRKY